MGKRRRRVRIPGFERVAFLVLLLGVAGLLIASTQIEDDPVESPGATAARTAETLRSAELIAVVTEPQVIAATSAAGRRRDRVRVAISVQLRSTSSKSISARRALRLEYSGRRILPDAAAKRDPSVLDLTTPMAPNSTRTGQVRFEISGDDTAVLRNRGDARLILVAPEGRRDGATLDLDVPA